MECQYTQLMKYIECLTQTMTTAIFLHSSYQISFAHIYCNSYSRSEHILITSRNYASSLPGSYVPYV